MKEVGKRYRTGRQSHMGVFRASFKACDMKSHRAPHSEGPHVWFHALLSQLEILNHFILDLKCMGYKI